MIFVSLTLPFEENLSLKTLVVLIGRFLFFGATHSKKFRRGAQKKKELAHLPHHTTLRFTIRQRFRTISITRVN